MIPLLLLYAVAGALLSGGVFGGKAVLDLAHDQAAQQKVRRRLQSERELMRDLIATEHVRDEAQRQGVDLDELAQRLDESAAAQRTLERIVAAVLTAEGMSLDTIRELLETEQPSEEGAIYRKPACARPAFEIGGERNP